MDGDQLIQRVKAKTFLRIQDLMISRDKETIVDPKFVDSWLQLGLGDPPTRPVEPSLEAIEWVWSASLTTMAIDLLWAVTAVATNRTFISNENNITAAVDSIGIEEVVRATGLKPEDVPVVLKQMAESLVEVIREHAVIFVEIDRKKFRLCAG